MSRADVPHGAVLFHLRVGRRQKDGGVIVDRMLRKGNMFENVQKFVRKYVCKW